MCELTHKPLVFLIGVTGFVGGSVFSELFDTGKYRFILLLRSKEKAAELAKLNDVETIIGSFDDADLISDAAYRSDITVEVASSDTLPEARAIVVGLTRKFHENSGPALYIQTSGSQILDEDVRGSRPSDYVYNDEDNEKLSGIPVTQPHRHVDIWLVDESEKGAFKLVLICPPLIYGEGMGPKGISSDRSLQVPTMISTAIKHRQVQQVGQGLSIWSNVNVKDLVRLYSLIVGKLLAGEDIPTNRKGYYFATTGEHSWNELAKNIASNLKRLGAVDTEEIRDNNDEESIIKTFEDKKAVGYLGSNSRSNGTKGRKLGWTNHPEKSQDLWEYVKWECERSVSEQKNKQ